MKAMLSIKCNLKIYIYNQGNIDKDNNLLKKASFLHNIKKKEQPLKDSNSQYSYHLLYFYHHGSFKPRKSNHTQTVIYTP